jgi:aryl-alcohol dehydrogenase-like predicted oxidoreductase
MSKSSSRRQFLAGSLALAAGETANGAGPAGPSYAMLGRTGLKVTRLVYGSCTGNEPKVITRAVDLGINFIDTSRDYQRGNNERLVAIGLKGVRDKVILSSKGIDVDVPGQPSAPQESVQEALAQLETSLKELQTDHLDIWYLHHKDRPDQITDALLEATRLAKKQGKIRFAGVSTHRIDATADFITKCEEIDVVMTTYSFLSPPEIGAGIEKVHKAGKGVVSFKSTAGGKRGSNPAMKRDGGMVAAYRWTLKNPNVDVVESNIESFAQLEENLAVMQPFTVQDEKLLRARFYQLDAIQCRMCGHCENACRLGLPVEDIQRYLMYAEGYGQFEFGREKFLRLPETIRQVSCGDCARCTVQCRFGIDVARQVGKAQNMFA